MLHRLADNRRGNDCRGFRGARSAASAINRPTTSRFENSAFASPNSAVSSSMRASASVRPASLRTSPTLEYMTLRISLSACAAVVRWFAAPQSRRPHLACFARYRIPTAIDARDVGSDPRTVNERFEQRVAREPIRSVHARRARFPAGPKICKRCAPPLVDGDSTHVIMRGRSNGNILDSRIDAGGHTEAEDRRKGRRELRADCAARIETDGSAALLLLEDRASDDVARRELGIGMQSRHEAFAQVVHEGRAFAADGLGDERHGIASDRKRRRMKLNELHIGEQCAGARRHRNAVAGRFDWIRRIAIEPPDAAGCKDDGSRRGTRNARPVAFSCAQTPATPQPSAIRSSAVTSSTTSIDRCSRTASMSVLRISCPVASPPAFTMRRR